MIESEIRTSSGQRRGEAEREIETLAVTVNGRSYYLRLEWPHPDFEATIADQGDFLVQAQRRFRGVHNVLQDLIAERKRLEAGGHHTEAGVVEKLKPLAAKTFDLIETHRAAAAGWLATAERDLSEVLIPGAESPFAPEIRAALRSLPEADRLKAFRDLSSREQAAILAAPAIVSGLPAQFHEANRHMVLDSLPAAAVHRQRAEIAATVTSHAEAALPIARAVAGEPQPLGAGALPS